MRSDYAHTRKQAYRAKPIGEGTEFRVVADFLGRKAALTYRIVEFAPGTAVTLRGENTTVVSLDGITVEPSGGARGSPTMPTLH